MSQEIKEEILSIDDLARKCGYFTADTFINNGYGCNHKCCEDGVYVYNDRIVNYWDAKIIIAKGLTKRNIKCNRRLAKKFIKKAILLLSRRIDICGVKFQGACFSYSCPLCRLAYPEDLPKFGMDPEDCGYDELVIINNSILCD